MAEAALAYSEPLVDIGCDRAPARAALAPSFGAAHVYERGCEIFGEDDAAERIYRVTSGAVRLVRYLDDGRRHISAFYFPGDIFGWERGARHGATAEAVTACRVSSFRRVSLDEEAAQGGAMARCIWEAASCELERSQRHALISGRLTAQERILAFLDDIAERLGDAQSIQLPMSRLDIADYLGLTIETVSRTMTQLERDGVIAMPSARRVVFLRGLGATAAALSR